MGNRILRKNLGDLVGKFYYGPRKIANTYFNANSLRDLTEQAKLKVGDVIYDCSGWNGRIAKIEPVWRPMYKNYNFKSKRGLYLSKFEIVLSMVFSTSQKTSSAKAEKPILYFIISSRTL
jgi:hypothetical protein